MRSQLKRRDRRRAIATVEFALVAPILLLLLAGVLDYAMLLRTATCAADAARAGTEYGMRSPSAAMDYAGIQAAALNSVPGLPGMTASATRTCKCSDGTAIVCTGSCTSGTVRSYVQVTTQVSAKTVFNYSGLKISNLVKGQALWRTQ
ncbi:MAG TPA: TadE/TadG family type IV pilus assembly protein [Candidatus Sulfopaludibacter sp.]|jgi:Flp pilus assembly protein TadG|nr:TadE/TadG family type IV pilus assembly protein [Candidatus Sulfopaludibacter sp.]